MSSFTVDGPLRADVTFGSGQLTVTPSPDGTATATVEALDPRDNKAVALADRAEIRLDRQTLTVEVREKGWRQSGAPVHVRLSLPPTSDVLVGAGDLTFTAEGELGDVRVRVGRGTVTVPSASGGVDIRSGDSTVVVGSAASIAIASGKTSLQAGTVGDLSLRAGQASIDVERSTGSVQVKGAAVTLDLHEVSSGGVVFETAAGRAAVGVKPGTSVQLDLESRTGTVRCDLPVSDVPTQPRADLRLRLKSATGDILVTQSRSAETAA